MVTFLLTYYVFCGCLMTSLAYWCHERHFMKGFKDCKAEGMKTLVGYLCLVIISWPVWVVWQIIVAIIERIR